MNYLSVLIMQTFAADFDSTVSYLKFARFQGEATGVRVRAGLTVVCLHLTGVRVRAGLTVV